jgi:hypothetical protein
MELTLMTLSRRHVLRVGLAAADVAATGGLTSLEFAPKAAAASSNVSPAGYITHLSATNRAMPGALPVGRHQGGAC